MKNIKIILLSLALITLPAQAGFKDTLIRTLPKVALGASLCSTMYPSAMKGIVHQVIRRDPTSRFPLDLEKSEWATSVLREHNLLGDGETILIGVDKYAAPEDREFISYNDSIITTPTDLNAVGNPICRLIHEEWHRRNQDSLKSIRANATFTAAGWLFSTALLRKGPWSKIPPTLFDSIGRSLVFYYSTKFAGSCTSSLLFPHFSRYQERNADKFMMMHIKDPSNLEEEAQSLRKDHLKDVQSLAHYPHYLRAYVHVDALVFNTHPSNLERAEYFEKAAAELRAKQQSKQS